MCLKQNMLIRIGFKNVYAKSTITGQQKNTIVNDKIFDSILFNS